MPRPTARILAVGLALLMAVLVGPAAALAQSAGDEQYADPFGDLPAEEPADDAPAPAPEQAATPPAPSDTAADTGTSAQTTVDSIPNATSSAPTASDELARTGLPAAPLFAVGIALLFSGAALHLSVARLSALRPTRR